MDSQLTYLNILRYLYLIIKNTLDIISVIIIGSYILLINLNTKNSGFQCTLYYYVIITNYNTYSII